MKDLTKKVVILNNFSSPYICEAIIVLRDYNPKLEGRIIDEAERIVSDYLEHHTPKRERPAISAAPKPPRKRKKNHPHVTAAVVLVVIAAVIAGIYYYFK